MRNSKQRDYSETKLVNEVHFAVDYGTDPSVNAMPK